MTFKRILSPFTKNRLEAIFGVTTLVLSSGLSLLQPTLASADTASQNVAKISFTFDDGLQSAFTKAQPTLAKYGITGTDYVITNCVGMTAPNTCRANPNANYMTWAQVEQLQADGWEIGSHTVDHPQMALADGTADGSITGGATQVETELTQSKADLAAHGINATDFAWPYGDYDNAALVTAAKYYATTRGFADDDTNNVYPYNDLLLHDQQFQASPAAPTWQLCTDLSVAGAKTCIDNAIANHQWLVLVFHNITDTPDTVAADSSYDESTSDLDAIAAYAAAKQQTGLAKVVNPNNGTVTGANLLTNGDFKNGIADGWTTDSPSTITADSGNNGRYPDPTHSVLLKGSATEAHLESPKVGVTTGQTYVLKNYLNMVTGGSVNFYIDEYDASGNWISGVDPSAGMTYAATGINAADINFSYTPSSANVASASLQVIVKGTTTKAYYDGAQFFVPGSSTVVTPPADTTAPVVSAVTTTGTSTTGSTIGWTTDEASTTQVNYGTTTSYGGSTVLNSSLTTSHTTVITGLAASTTYHYQVVSTDASGNTAKSTDYTFTTSASGTTLVPGDVNGDGVVNIKDATLVSINWNRTNATRAQGDLNGDGVVNIKDATLVSINWGK